MTDEELAGELCPNDSPEIGISIVKGLTDAHRTAYERLVSVGREIELYEAGLMPKPLGVIICGPREIRIGRRSIVGRSPPQTTGEDNG